MAQHTELAEPQAITVGASHFVFPASGIGRLIEALATRGYDVFGPVARDGAVIYDHIASAADLPAGWTDEQSPGSYRLKPCDDKSFFAFAVGPQSWKKFLHPADVCLVSAVRENKAFRILNDEPAPPRPYAFLGVRACDLHAIAVQDRVLLGDKYRDPLYQERRNGAFIAAVHCTHSVSTCFCASMGSGPRAHTGFDVALTELTGEDGHRFIVDIGSERGAAVIADLHLAEATAGDLRAADASIELAAHSQVRTLDIAGIQELLYQNFDHPRWDEVARRCLSCANCTMVCPTCFCTNVNDLTDVIGERAERRRQWDSCFTLAFSYIHGGNIRNSPKSRYRQWLTHKLAAWFDQFSSSGCVGCGRCITWCPAGIDLTEEVRAMRETHNGKP
jgi:sulfhydrogenase subunit beta (sulfur reductase)